MMKEYTYPAVFYYDDEYNDYAVEFSDICIYCEGDTVEEAYTNAQEYLTKYIETCEELGVVPNPPSNYDGILKMHPNGKTMFVTINYESKKHDDSKMEKPQESYTNLNNDIVEDIEKGIDGQDGGDDDFSLPEIE